MAQCACLVAWFLVGHFNTELTNFFIRELYIMLKIALFFNVSIAYFRSLMKTEEYIHNLMFKGFYQSPLFNLQKKLD